LWIRPEGELVIDTDTASVRPVLFQACPSVRFRSDLYASYHNTGDKPTQLFLSHAKRSYATLRSALAYRSDSIRRVLEVIATEQQEALLAGVPLQPLTQRDIALRTGLSETTVSRVCKNRYILFRNRTYKIQHFLSRAYEKEVGSSISDDEVKRKLLALIDTEDRTKPYSDNALTKLLVAQNIPIARRTITKLRLQLGIPNSTIRKAHNSNS
jgi:RNA polymerase sigma-54 factor